MVYDKIIKGNFVKLKSITLDDAEFSYNLRRDPRFVSIMGQPAKTLEDQKKFIEWQMKQPGDYYFVVLNNANEKIGLLGVYNINGDICETGREINIGAPYETIEAGILLCEFCINVLKLKKKVGIIYKHNKRQISLQHKFGLEPIGEEIRNGIPAYRYEVEFSDLQNKYVKAKKMIEKLVKRGNDNVL